MMENILSLEPKALWKHFAAICSIPHPSKHEEAILSHIINFAKTHSLNYTQDSVGNIVIKKNATPRFESKEIIAIQAHVDMVPQKNSDTTHNFLTDAIQPKIVGARVKATQTTLGADNGIGLAAILAILESKNIPHGPIEALFTIDEETGMTGAKNLDPNILQAKYLINTDSEIENEITIGCAGGIDGNFIFDIKREPTPKETISYTISVSGLSGGHSGFEIHLGRANANICISRFLHNVTQHFGVLINEFNGGNMRNAIPREASATIVVPLLNQQNFETYTQQFFNTLQTLHTKTDPKFCFNIHQTKTPETVIYNSISHSLLQALIQCPNEVIGVEKENPKVIQTSTNLSIISTHDSKIEVNCLLRSVSESEKHKLADSMKQLFSLYGATCSFAGDYPGWEPVWNSGIISIVEQALEKVYNKKPNIQVVHAGLECGIFSSIYPQIEYISFGPTIRNPHSPDEEVDIASVNRYWETLCLVLASIPNKKK